MKNRRNTALLSYVVRATLCALGVFCVLNFARADDYLSNPVSCDYDSLQSYENAILKAKYDVIDYNITLHYEPGALNPSYVVPTTYNIESETIILPIPEYVGYDFGGWYNVSNFDGEKFTEIPHGSTGDKEYWAKWQEHSYSITYLGVENSDWADPASVPYSFFITDEIDIPRPKNRESSGYEFISWCLGENVYGCETDFTKINAGTSEDIYLTAQWAPVDYTISYQNTSGVNFDIAWQSAENVPYSYNKDTSVIIPQLKNQNGYVFDGWCINQDKCSNPLSETVMFPETDKNGSVDDTKLGNKVLYAQWSPVEYNINYVLCDDFDARCKQDSNNNPSNPATYTIKDTVVFAAPTRIGYDFDGWYDGNEKITQFVGETGDKTIYARWKKHKYTVSYMCERNGNIVRRDETDFESGYTFATNTAPDVLCSKTGYTFTGWVCSYKDNNNNTINVPTDDVVSWNIEYDVQCVPNDWLENTYNIKFRPNGSYVMNTMPDQVCRYSENCVLTKNNYVRSGYEFDGWCDNWNTATNVCDGTSYSDKATITRQTKDVVLYAKWRSSEIVCDAGYYLKAGEYENCRICPRGSFCAGGTYSYDALNDQGITSCGNYFASSAVTTDSDGAKSLSECYVPCPTTKGNYVIDTQYNKIRYNEKENDVCKYKAEIVYAPETNCESQTYFSTDNTSIKLCVPEINVPGQTFVGWIDNKNNKYNVSGNPRLENITIRETVPVNGVVTMTPNWNLEKYTVNYNCSNGVNITDTGIEYNSTITMPDYSRCNNPGTTLQNWECDYDFASANYKMPAKNVQCNANIATNKYNIVFDANGADSGNMEDMTGLLYNNTYVLNKNNYTKQGYSFNGWCDALNTNTGNCNGNKYSDKQSIKSLTSEDNATITLFATWTPVIYTISYDVPYNIDVSNRTTYTVETPTFTLNNPSRVGYNFVAWCTNKDLDENCSQTKTIRRGTTGNLHFFAHIEQDVYTITYKYKLNGVEHNISNMFDDAFTKRTVNQTVLYPTNVNVSGYTFNGWYSNPEFRYGTVQGVYAGDTENKTVWAKLTPISCLENQFINENGVCEQCPDNSHSVGGNATKCDCDDNYYKTSNGKCEPITYTINYVYNGGTPTNNPTTYTVADDAWLLKAPTKDNYKFKGWFINSSLTGEPITVMPGNLSGNITLYAGWDYSPCPVDYYFQNNVCKQCPEHSHSMGGFATKCDCDTYYESDNTNGCRLKTYKINYVYDGGALQNGQSNLTQYTINTTNTELYEPVKQNYTFTGWHLGSINGVVLTSVSGDLAREYGNITLYAKWNKNPDVSTITFDCGNGKSITKNGYVGTAIDIPTTTDCEIETGEITGWLCGAQTYSLPGTMNIQNGDVICNPVISYADVVYNIIYKGYDTKGNEIDLGFVRPKTYISRDGFMLPLKQDINVAGYEFVGWYSRYANKNFYYRIESGFAPNTIGDKTVYGKFNPMKYHCDSGYYLPANSTQCIACDEIGTYCPGGDFEYSDVQKGKMNCTDSYPLSSGDSSAVSDAACYTNCDTQLNYTLVSGYKYKNGFDNCVYNPITYYVYYNTNGGNTISPRAFTVETPTITDLPTPYRSNYDFGGWVDENGIVITRINTLIGKDINLYAKWNEKPCEETQYKLNGQCIACPENSHGAKDGTPQCVCDEGFVKTDSQSCEPIKYNINYVGLNGASNALNPTTYTAKDYGKEIHNPSNRQGYDFIGWTRDSIMFTRIPYSVRGDITLNANWRIKTIHCNPGEYLPANSETCTPCDEENVYCPGGDMMYSDVSNGKNACPYDYPYAEIGASRITQCFRKCLDTNVPGAIYADGNDTCDYTYPIMYELDGGAFNTDYPMSYEHGVGTLPLANPYKHGYLFGGWYENPEKQGIATRSIDTNRYGTLTLYAKWHFACESGVWLHVGGSDKLCLYKNKPELPAMVIETKNGKYYMMLTQNGDKPIHDGSDKKMHIEINGRTYNAYDASVDMN